MAAVPDSRRVADALRVAILAGELVDGQRLPSLTALATEHDVTLDAARQAIVTLRAEQLVTTRQGAGSFVSRFPLIVRRSPGRLSRGQWGQGKAIHDSDTELRLRTVDVVVSEEPASTELAEALGIKPETALLVRSRRFIVDDRPVQLATSYLPLRLVRGSAITYTDTGPGGTYARLAELGHAPVRFTEAILARAPHPSERERLALGSGALVFEIQRRAFTDSGRCVEVTRMVLDATAYRLEYNFDN